ncbi:MAG: arsenosugar biosynthesis radical SAM protein ArsS [Bdellovibrionaceae bacterium]|nr:arsenosugar biosynthesis radical SAM protein ArsS [Bdellovibrio sp.]
MIQSLKARKSDLANSDIQVKQLNTFSDRISALEPFTRKMKKVGLFPLKPTQLEIFQINVGKMCNQTCKHCHVDAGPDRKEIMTRETMEKILNILKSSSAHTVDLTGGAPEMNKNFRWFVEQLSLFKKNIIVRCNLTIIMANKSYNDLPEFYKKHNIHIVSSLPYYEKGKTDSQRGDGVFQDSIEALKKLNAAGYGKPDTGLKLDLVYNPSGAFLPGSQIGLEKDFKAELMRLFGIEFNQLFAITNMPISRYLDYLIQTDNYEAYMEKLVNAFNPTAAKGVMCRNTISIGWDGFIYDCDFNQMLDMKVASPDHMHLDNYNEQNLQQRSVILNQHCYGCTAGQGSSCGGTTS